MSALKASDVERCKTKDEIELKNRRMTEPLRRMKHEVSELNQKVQKYNEEKELLEETKSSLLDEEEKLKVLDWEHEVLVQRISALAEERDQLKERFNEAIYDVQQKAGFKNLLLEKRLTAVGEDVEKADAQLDGVQQLTEESKPPHVSIHTFVLPNVENYNMKGITNEYCLFIICFLLLTTHSSSASCSFPSPPHLLALDATAHSYSSTYYVTRLPMIAMKS